jgi:hypothetical protein
LFALCACGDTDAAVVDAGNGPGAVLLRDAAADVAKDAADGVGKDGAAFGFDAGADAFVEATPDSGLGGVCLACSEKAAACYADPGCVEIEQCVKKHGCKGALCYLGVPECMAIIDKSGGATGLSAAFSTQLQACIDDNPGCLPDEDAGTP